MSIQQEIEATLSVINQLEDFLHDFDIYKEQQRLEKNQRKCIIKYLLI